MLSSWKKIPQIKRHAIVGAIICLGMLIYSFFAVDSVLDFMSRTVIMMLFASALNIILGFGGLVGAQRTELMEGIFGMRHIKSGEVYIKGKKMNIKRPQDAIRGGIGMITEDRRGTGILGCLSIADNVSISSLDQYLHYGIKLNKKKIEQLVKDNVAKLSIKTPSSKTLIQSLSGGNQQKVLISRWLANNPDILIMDEPTRGIDVGAKYEIYQIMIDLAKQGKGIIMISSEMPELIGMSNRILVMCNGHITGEVQGEEATQERIMSYATKF